MSERGAPGAGIEAPLSAGGRLSCPGGSRLSKRRVLSKGGRRMPPGGSGYRRESPFQGMGVRKISGAGGVGESRSRIACRSGGRGRSAEAPGVLRGSALLSSRPAPSGQGKAGAAWGCRPTEHPLPSPAGNPAGSRICLGLALARSVFGKNRPCHKPLGNRHHARPSGRTRSKQRLTRRYVSWRRASGVRSVEQEWTSERAGQ